MTRAADDFLQIKCKVRSNDQLNEFSVLGYGWSISCIPGIIPCFLRSHLKKQQTKKKEYMTFNSEKDCFLMSPQTVLLRTTLTRPIIIYRLKYWLQYWLSLLPFTIFLFISTQDACSGRMLSEVGAEGHGLASFLSWTQN